MPSTATWSRAPQCGRAQTKYMETPRESEQRRAQQQSSHAHGRDGAAPGNHQLRERDRCQWRQCHRRQCAAANAVAMAGGMVGLRQRAITAVIQRRRDQRLVVVVMHGLHRRRTGSGRWRPVQHPRRHAVHRADDQNQPREPRQRSKGWRSRHMAGSQVHGCSLGRCVRVQQLWTHVHARRTLATAHAIKLCDWLSTNGRQLDATRGELVEPGTGATASLGRVYCNASHVTC